MGDSSFFHTPATPVPILQRQDEFERLLALYRHRRPMRVVEIGTYHGGTLFHWLQNAAAGATVVTVDSYTTGVDNRPLYQSWTPDGVTLCTLVGDSHDPNVLEHVRQEVGTIDWLFIDANHLEQEVRLDYRLYASLVAPGGVIILHDILDHVHHPELQVWRLWQDIQDAKGGAEEYVSDPEQEDCGIGVIYTSQQMNVITALTRTENLPALRDSLIRGLADAFDVHWWIVLNTEPEPLPAEMVAMLRSGTLSVTVLHCPSSGYDASGMPAFGHRQRSFALDHIQSGWVWTLDDDNLCHPDFGERLQELMREYPAAGGLVLGQQRADGQRLYASASNLGPGTIDTAQYVLRRDIIGDERIRPIYMDDGSFVKRVYDQATDQFIFCDEALTWHNRLVTEEASPVPRLSLPDLSHLVPASPPSSPLTPALPDLSPLVPDLSYLGGHQQMTNMDERTLDYLSERYCIQGMLDVGCGPGGMVEAALQRGISAIGIDGDPAMAERNPFVFVHDYTVRPLHWTPVDLLWCVEFVEHVEEVYVANFLETFRSARILFLTHAVPGQGGYHHVNEQEAKYWQDLIQGLGFSLEDEATSWVRNHANNMYTRATGMVFINKGRFDMKFNGPKRPRI